MTNSTVIVDGQELTNITAVAVGTSQGPNLALKNDGTVVGWGWNIFGQATGASSENGSGPVVINSQTLNNCKAVAAGRTESIALKNDRTVVIWGADNAGRKIDVPPDLKNAVAVAAGWDHCLVLERDGTVVMLAAGSDVRLGVSNVVAIAAGQGYGFGVIGSDLLLQTDGSVKEIYRGIYDESGALPREWTNIVAIAAGGAATLALTRDGRVFGWGANDRGQATGVPTTNYIASGYVTIGGQSLTDVKAIAAGVDVNVALKRDGTVVAWGGNGKATIPEGLSNVVAIAVGIDYCLAITTNSTVADHFRSK
jgi:alpha-tubulin suppressor-like RCC1 family protein